MQSSPFIDSVRRHKIQEVRQLMQQGEKLPADISDFDRSQFFTLLAREKAWDLIDILVQNKTIGTDLYEYDKLEGTMLEALMKNLSDSEDDLQFLRSFAASLENISDAVQDKTLLDLAFVNNRPVAVIRTLIEAGCDPHYKNNYQINFLYKVIQEFGIKEEQGSAYIELLLNEGLDVNEANVAGETPLHLAISKNKKQYIQLLLANGADPNQQNSKGENAFYQALVHQVCTTDLYRQLAAAAPADWTLTTKDGETIFIGSLRMRRHSSTSDIAVLKALIEDGADIYQESPYYGKPKSALDWIIEHPADTMEAILQLGIIDINRKDDKGNTLLHKVCATDVNYDQETARQLYKKVKLLLESGADANSTNDADQTPVMLASNDNLKSKTVELLLKNKA